LSTGIDQLDLLTKEPTGRGCWKSLCVKGELLGVLRDAERKGAVLQPVLAWDCQNKRAYQEHLGKNYFWESKALQVALNYPLESEVLNILCSSTIPVVVIVIYVDYCLVTEKETFCRRIRGEGLVT
jgi:hypothetical protein